MNKDINTVSKSICYFVLMISVILPLAILNLKKVLAQPQAISIKVGESPQVLEYNPSNGNIYVANFNSGDISIIDSNTKVFNTFNVGDDPQVIKYNPSNGNIYIANENSGNVSLITTAHTMNSTDQKNSFAFS